MIKENRGLSGQARLGQFGGLNRWKIARGKAEQCKGSGLHKQFTVDRMAVNVSARSTLKDSGSKSYLRIPVGGMKWWFQKFKVDVKGKNKKAEPIRTDMSPILGAEAYNETGSIRDYLAQLPLGKSLRSAINLFEDGVNVTDANNSYKQAANDGSYNDDDVVDLASPGTLLIDAMYTSGLVPGNEEFIEKIKAAMQDPD